MEHHRAMDIDERRAELREIFRDDEHAVDFFCSWIRLTEVWDDLVDRDRAVTNEDIHDAFWIALVVLPGSPLYAQHGATLRATMLAAILAWHDSNAMRAERGGAEDMLTAHVVRYQVVDVALAVIAERHGWRYAATQGPRLRRMFRCETFPDFVKD